MNRIEKIIDNCFDCENASLRCMNYDQGTGEDYIEITCLPLDRVLGESKRKRMYCSIPSDCPILNNKSNKYEEDI